MRIRPAAIIAAIVVSAKGLPQENIKLKTVTAYPIRKSTPSKYRQKLLNITIPHKNR